MEDKDIRQKLIVQTKFWNNKEGYEKGQCQQFWNSILRCFNPQIDLPNTIVYEKQVKDPATGSTKFIDAYIPHTRIIIEQKSSNIALDKPEPQSGGAMLTPFQQAERYDNWLPLDEKARYIVCSNFRFIEIHDRNKPLEPPFIIPFTEDGVSKNYYRLKFLLDQGSTVSALETAVSKAAAIQIGSLYNDILRLYSKEEITPELFHNINVFCVRLVFCLYAEDALVFSRKDMFGLYLKNYNKNRDEFRLHLKLLFQTLNTPPSERDSEDLRLNEFPYTNGGLFANNVKLPKLTENIAFNITQNFSLGFDWSPINPAIFGAMFESTLSSKDRREGGMHYTTTENIDKALAPLFLDELRSRLSNAINIPDLSAKRDALLRLQDELASIRILDPACGSGNFLTYCYMELRRMENKILYELHTAGLSSSIKVSLSQFHGFEINEFAVDTAKTALWIAQNQMLHETQQILGENFAELPLCNIDTIHCLNALQINWEDYIKPKDLDYIVGNPPFVGARIMNEEQKKDIINIFGKDWKNVGNMDYVTCWYKKAFDYIKQNSKIRCAFVSTNSICQGEQVANLWKPLMDGGLRIIFAYRTFKWESDSVGMAHVHCVIVGFDLTPQPPLLRGEGEEERSMANSSEGEDAYNSISSMQSSHPSPLRRGVGGEVEYIATSSSPLQSSHPSPLRRGDGGEVNTATPSSPSSFSRSAAAEVIRHQRITPEKLEMARSFRKNPTESEDAVWQMIRNRKIRNLKWRRQQIIDGFIADFYCAELNAVLEIDGSVHETEEAMLYDEARTEIFARRGIKTYRIKNSDCNIINVTKLVERMISDLTPQPPLLEGEGEEACSMESSSSPIQSSHPSPSSSPMQSSHPSPLRRGVGGEVKTPLPSSTPMQSSHPSPLRRGVGGEVKHIYNPDGTIETAKNINAYLLNGSNVFVESRNKPICAVPEIGIGNKPIDGGNYLFTETEKDEFIKQEPNSAKFFRPWYGSEEFINGKKRFCLWLGDANPLELAKLPKCLERIKAVKEFRLASKSEGTRKIAAKPTRFHVENFPDGNYLLIPKVSSEKRKYIPIGFMDKNDFSSDLVFIIPNATLYEFGILTSIVHNAWMRVVAGRLKSDYRYSKDIVYNNFPWPKSIDNGQLTIDNAAQKILDIREKYLSEGASLATLYGENLDLLFTDLAEAHRELDAIVLGLYGLKKDATEAEMVARLFEMIF